MIPLQKYLRDLEILIVRGDSCAAVLYRRALEPAVRRLVRFALDTGESGTEILRRIYRAAERLRADAGWLEHDVEAVVERVTAVVCDQAVEDLLAGTRRAKRRDTVRYARDESVPFASVN
jgi:hypothetical protein